MYFLFCLFLFIKWSSELIDSEICVFRETWWPAPHAPTSASVCGSARRRKAGAHRTCCKSHSPKVGALYCTRRQGTALLAAQPRRVVYKQGDRCEVESTVLSKKHEKWEVTFWYCTVRILRILKTLSIRDMNELHFNKIIKFKLSSKSVF